MNDGLFSGINRCAIIRINKTVVGLMYEAEVLLCVSVVGLAIRWAFFYPAVIDPDESTFIIVGQSAADGFLPYQIAWDIKPPLVFWWFGAAIKLFGATIPEIRFAGFLWLVMASYLLYKAALSTTQSRLGGVFAAAMLIVASSAYSPYVSTETLAVLPMAGAILVLQGYRQRLRSVFLSGVLLGQACMFRLNLIYLSFVVGIFLCIHEFGQSWRESLYRGLNRGVWFFVGIATSIILTFLPYLISARLRLGMEFYEAAIQFAGGPHSIANNAAKTIGEFADLVGVSVWGAATLGAFVVSKRWKDFNSNDRSNWLLCVVFLFGTLLSLVMTHTAEVPVLKHYFTQLAPGLSMFAAAIFIPQKKCVEPLKVKHIKRALAATLVFLVVFQTSTAEWSTLIRRFRTGQPSSYGIEYDIAELIRSQGSKDYSLFMMTNHLVYWLLGRYPPTRLVTHPSDISKPAIRQYLEPDSKTTEAALRNVFSKEPTFVVYTYSPKLLWFLNNDPSAVHFLEQELSSGYVLIGRMGLTQVFRRKNSQLDG